MSIAERHDPLAVFQVIDTEPLQGVDPEGNDGTLMDYSSLSAAPAVGALTFRSSEELKGSLVFLLDCDKCVDGVKEISIASGMMVSQLGDVILGHRELHADLDTTPAAETTYAQDLIAATLHQAGPLAGVVLPREIQEG